MKNTTIKQVEEYSCQTYGVTMEQVTERNTKIKAPLQAKKLIIFLLIEYHIMSKAMVMNHYNWSYQPVNNAWIKTATNRSVDIELNSVITEFEKQTT